MLTEEFGIVLDFLPKGKSTDFKEEPLAQIIGENYFTLLEVTTKQPVQVGEKLYIGKKERDKVNIIKRRINFSQLTLNSKDELSGQIKKIVSSKPEKFLEFFNKSGPISIKRHALELLPSMGKKHLKKFLEEREKKPFESFEDIKKRVPHIVDPVKLIIKRILLELDDSNLKHYLFTRPPKKDRFFHKRLK